MSTQFTAGPTRDVQPGDTPDLNDGLLSRIQAVQNIARGVACYLNSASTPPGAITIGTAALGLAGNAPFVPIESVDNSGGAVGDTEMSGVTPPQRVALTWEADTTAGLTIAPGDYLKIFGVVGNVARWTDGDTDAPKYARFLGIEAALLDRDATTPFDETLTPGIVPDQSVTLADGETKTIWVQLMENTEPNV